MVGGREAQGQLMDFETQSSMQRCTFQGFC